MTRYGMDVVYARPPEFSLDPRTVERARRNAQEMGGSFSETENLGDAFKGAHVIYMRNHTTLNFGNVGAQAEQATIDKYKDWTCNQSLMDLAATNSIFMHCLPVDRGHEVTNEIIDGPRSAVYDEAENRLHVQKAVLSLVMS